MQVPYKICAVYEEFEQELESGRYPYAMADRNTVLGLAHRKVPEGVFVITLLKIQEHTLMSEQAQDLTVFVPLFGIQCPALLKKLAETGPASGAEPSPDSLSGYPYTRVLLVDDNALNLEIAEELMKPYGMQVDCVHSGQEAVDAVLARTYLHGPHDARYGRHGGTEKDTHPAGPARPQCSCGGAYGQRFQQCPGYVPGPRLQRLSGKAHYDTKTQ